MNGNNFGEATITLMVLPIWESAADFSVDFLKAAKIKEKRIVLLKLLLAYTPDDMLEDTVTYITNGSANVLSEIAALKLDTSNDATLINSLIDFPQKLAKAIAAIRNLNVEKILYATSKTLRPVNRLAGIGATLNRLLIGDIIGATADALITYVGDVLSKEVQEECEASFYHQRIRNQIGLRLCMNLKAEVVASIVNPLKLK